MTGIREPLECCVLSWQHVIPSPKTLAYTMWMTVFQASTLNHLQANKEGSASLTGAEMLLNSSVVLMHDGDCRYERTIRVLSYILVTSHILSLQTLIHTINGPDSTSNNHFQPNKERFAGLTGDEMLLIWYYEWWGWACHQSVISSCPHSIPSPSELPFVPHLDLVLIVWHIWHMPLENLVTIVLSLGWCVCTCFCGDMGVVCKVSIYWCATDFMLHTSWWCITTQPPNKSAYCPK